MDLAEIEAMIPVVAPAPVPEKKEKEVPYVRPKPPYRPLPVRLVLRKDPHLDLIEPLSPPMFAFTKDPWWFPQYMPMRPIYTQYCYPYSTREGSSRGPFTPERLISSDTRGVTYYSKPFARLCFTKPWYNKSYNYY